MMEENSYGWTNRNTWQVWAVLCNIEPLFVAVRDEFNALGEDLNLYFRSEDDGEFQDFFVPKLAKHLEDVVRNFNSPELVQEDYVDVNWGEIAAEFVELWMKPEEEDARA